MLKISKTWRRQLRDSDRLFALLQEMGVPLSSQTMRESGKHTIFISETRIRFHFDRQGRLIGVED